jgi:hypothetical protein
LAFETKIEFVPNAALDALKISGCASRQSGGSSYTMNAHLKEYCIGFGTVCLVQVALTASASGDSATRFNFSKNHPLIFAVESTTRTVTSRTMHMEMGDSYSVIQNSVVMRYKLKLTPVRKSTDGTWTLHYEPLDRHELEETIDENGHVSTSIDNLDVKSSRDNVVVIDTVNGIGSIQAKPFKHGVYPKLLSGYFDFKPTGAISKVDGDLPFIDFWTDTIKYQVGFFAFVFAPGPGPHGACWTADITLKDLQETIKLGGNGILETNQFCRDEHAATSNGRNLAYVGSLEAHQKNLAGNMDLMGQDTKVNITDFDHSKSGTFQFDPQIGCLTDGNQQESVKISLELMYKGNPVTMKTDLGITSMFQLVKD